MRHRLRSVLLAALLGPVLTSCLPSSFGSPFFHFVEPDELEVFVDSEFSFALRAPSPSAASDLKIWLDGDEIDPAAITHDGNEVSGTLQGVAPGYHTLFAEIRLQGPFFDFPLFAWRVVEVAGPAQFKVRGSIEQVHVTHASPGATIQLLDDEGELVQEGVADYQGSLIFREVEPGSGYRVFAKSVPSGLSDPFDVLPFQGSTPPPEFYQEQVLEPGFGYITTRDGTKLSAFVSLPGPPEEGPYPVLVNYSGYTPSQPAGAMDLGGIDLSFLCDEIPVLCNAANAPEALLAGVLGFATVGVNMRGTGCSGGA